MAEIPPLRDRTEQQLREKLRRSEDRRKRLIDLLVRIGYGANIPPDCGVEERDD